MMGKTLRLFNLEDFIKILKEKGVNLVAVCQRRKNNNYRKDISILATASVENYIVELVYYRTIRPFVDENVEKEIVEKAEEIAKKLEEYGFNVVDGVWKWRCEYEGKD